MKRRVAYGVDNYEELVRDNGYFVDKTPYIEKLETIKNPVFLRPRRFGKSLWCRILDAYYNVNRKDDFDRLFGHTYIGHYPTPLRNAYIILPLNFSIIDPKGTIEEIERRFDYMCNLRLRTTVGLAEAQFQNRVEVDLNRSISDNLEHVLTHIEHYHLPPLYIIIDEYDNFANQLIMANRDQLYRELTADDSFLKIFFKILKEGRGAGTIANVYITGVLPITIDDLASSFNIATFLTLDSEFEAMLGFTQAEVDRLLDNIYQDYGFDPVTRPEVDAIIKNHYNGYRFVTSDGEALYNSTILMYFLRDFTRHRQIPKFLTDQNLRTDLSWIKRITGAHPADTEALIGQLTTENTISYDDNMLTNKFNMSQFFAPSFHPVSLFYLGLLTRRDLFVMSLPNLNMRQIFAEYFNELHHIDVSTRYADMMQRFVNHPDLEQLFTGYWEQYVSQLPEAIFSQVNENFYRTTFFELCSRYLSHWFTWNVERSYPQGKSDLEFVGKYHEKFSGLRWVIEFKYYSNAELNRLRTSVDSFQLQLEDIEQVAGYVEGLKAEYPEARISQYVIYCFGNQGFRVFTV
ncbi:AAA family ATPase [Candidatus Entotheonella palauensis]|uniref:ATPase AAA n=1 Tax=Candidatus Entotheonella gemina TaxID=1429439 RepID=W4MBP0_9BACT|nr:AAA family ATPase [Candidatus Entotheonella palauensis]ETX07067.1 MAG: ATPase AAA [Candidatus Entotheonella gemina]